MAVPNERQASSEMTERAPALELDNQHTSITIVLEGCYVMVLAAMIDAKSVDVEIPWSPVF